MCVFVCVEPCVCGGGGGSDFVEVSFNSEHERRIICINCMLSGGLGVAAILRKDMREHGEKKKKNRKHDPALWCCRKKEEAWIRERVKIGRERVLPCLPVGLNCPGTSYNLVNLAAAWLQDWSHIKLPPQPHVLRWCNQLEKSVNVQNCKRNILCKCWITELILMLCCVCVSFRRGP